MNGKELTAPAFFDSIREILRIARQKAYNSVNFIMVEAYWRIGQRIVEVTVYPPLRTVKKF